MEEMVPIMEAMKVGGSSGGRQGFPLQVMKEKLMAMGGGAASGSVWGGGRPAPELGAAADEVGASWALRDLGTN